MDDEAGEEVGGVDYGQGLQQAGGRASTLMSVAAEDADRQHVTDTAEHTQRTDDVHVDEQLVPREVSETLARRSRRLAPAPAARRHVEPRDR